MNAVFVTCGYKSETDYAVEIGTVTGRCDADFTRVGAPHGTRSGLPESHIRPAGCLECGESDLRDCFVQIKKRCQPKLIDARCNATLVGEQEKTCLDAQGIQGRQSSRANHIAQALPEKRFVGLFDYDFETLFYPPGLRW